VNLLKIIAKSTSLGSEKMIRKMSLKCKILQHCYYYAGEEESWRNERNVTSFCKISFKEQYAFYINLYVILPT
jgi:hypothetical protein